MSACRTTGGLNTFKFSDLRRCVSLEFSTVAHSQTQGTGAFELTLGLNPRSRLSEESWGPGTPTRRGPLYVESPDGGGASRSGTWYGPSGSRPSWFPFLARRGFLLQLAGPWSPGLTPSLQGYVSAHIWEDELEIPQGHWFAGDVSFLLLGCRLPPSRLSVCSGSAGPMLDPGHPREE